MADSSEDFTIELRFGGQNNNHLLKTSVKSIIDSPEIK
jgi:hypothetical protein